MPNDHFENNFPAFAEKMRDAGVPEIAISHFKTHYQQLLRGETGFIPESSIQPVDDLPAAGDLADKLALSGERVLAHTVLLKLNGGLGTSMGLETTKSLIRVKAQYSFLDIIARHAIHSRVHLLLMNSYNTREDSLQLLQNYPALKATGLALDFLQHKVLKINRHDLMPAVCAGNRQLEWCPPGHGDIYIALVSSGMLAALLAAGYRYALVSNADNLGAVLDTRLLGYLVAEQIPFLMEVTERTQADKKGGHLARLPDGRLLLRESAQCMPEDREAFENIARHKFFNTNNLWVDLQALQDTLDRNNRVLDLPLICNAKTLDPRDPGSCPVYQLETAMGSAISVFAGARAIHVQRSRFAPVKTTNDLLLVRSDVYTLHKNYTLSSKLAADAMPLIDLDREHYGLIDAFESRFPCGPPTLAGCQGLSVRGDISFGENISVHGKVKLINRSKAPVNLPANCRIDADMHWD